MKINNPTVFYNVDPTLEAQFQNKMKLICNRDIIRLFSETDSSLTSDWHLEETERDVWVKYSFDGGTTWILKLRYKNNLKLKIGQKLSSENDHNKGTSILFQINNILDEYTVETINNSTISLLGEGIPGNRWTAYKR